jgi:hypothetical protein
MKKVKKILITIFIIFLLIFIATDFISKYIADRQVRNYLNLLDIVAFFGLFIFAYLTLLFYDLDAKRLLLSKILFYILLGTSITIFGYYFCCDAWAGAISLYFLFAAIIHFIVVYFIKQSVLSNYTLSLRKEFMVLLIFIVVILIFFFVPIKGITVK